MDILGLAIDAVKRSELSFCKFISANDAGSTGAHQSGFYIPKNSTSLLFDSAGIRGSNKDRYVTIKWQGDFETASRFIYYGTGTRNEYRVTRFGKGFPYLSDENVGNLLVLTKITEEFYEGFVLESDSDFENFFSAFNIDASRTNALIPKDEKINPEDALQNCFTDFVDNLNDEFPRARLLSERARFCYNNTYLITLQAVLANPDVSILKWLFAEFELFKAIENKVYATQLKSQFKNVEDLVVFANTILNRRKSRAGKSLENHLEEILKCNKLNFETQVVTEGNKKPDFLFPNKESYDDKNFRDEDLIFLASKTTCKDRWRQIINEADRIKTKHLFTLQQGISSNQLKEMTEHNVKLVVPRQYISSFPEQHRSDILSLDQFIKFARSVQRG